MDDLEKMGDKMVEIMRSPDIYIKGTAQTILKAILNRQIKTKSEVDNDVMGELRDMLPWKDFVKFVFSEAVVTYVVGCKNFKNLIDSQFRPLSIFGIRYLIMLGASNLYYQRMPSMWQAYVDVMTMYTANIFIVPFLSTKNIRALEEKLGLDVNVAKKKR